MIQTQSMLEVADNSWCTSRYVYQGFGGSHRRYAGIGDIIR